MDLSTIRHREPIEAVEAAPDGPRFEVQIAGKASLIGDGDRYSVPERLAAAVARGTLLYLRVNRSMSGGR